MSKRVPVWIDTDCGVDDAIAILMALKLEQLDVVGCSAVAGNAELKHTFRNTRNILFEAGRSDIPVYKGSDKPLIIPLETAPYVHGENGVGDSELNESNAAEEEEKAWDALYRKALECEGELEVVAIGPLTNIAITILKYPDFVNKVKAINIMGGSALEGGNVTMSAEFNIYVDPHGAQVVFKSGVHVNVFGLDVTKKLYLSKENFDEICGYGNRVAEIVKAITPYYVGRYFPGKKMVITLHDSCPLLYLAFPEKFGGLDCGVFVETQGSITFGKTITDLYSYSKFDQRNSTVFFDIDSDYFLELIKNIFRNY